jgi:hypothetical protein
MNRFRYFRLFGFQMEQLHLHQQQSYMFRGIQKKDFLPNRHRQYFRQLPNNDSRQHRRLRRFHYFQNHHLQ